MTLDLTLPALSLSYFPQNVYLYRYPASSPLPAEVQINLMSPFGPTGKTPSPSPNQDGVFLSVTRTSNELSIITDSETLALNKDTEKEGPYTLLFIRGPLELTMTGVLATLLQPLKDEGIPIFVISTFDTDYVMVKSKDQVKTTETLAAAGWRWN